MSSDPHYSVLQFPWAFFHVCFGVLHRRLTVAWHQMLILGLRISSLLYECLFFPVISISWMPPNFRKLRKTKNKRVWGTDLLQLDCVREKSNIKSNYKRIKKYGIREIKQPRKCTFWKIVQKGAKANCTLCWAASRHPLRLLGSEVLTCLWKPLPVSQTMVYLWRRNWDIQYFSPWSCVLKPEPVWGVKLFRFAHDGELRSVFLQSPPLPAPQQRSVMFSCSSNSLLCEHHCLFFCCSVTIWNINSLSFVSVVLNIIWG